MTDKIYITDAPLHPFATTIPTPPDITFSAVVGSFTDSDPNAQVSYYAATINWGDGTYSTGTIIYNSLTQRFDVHGSHYYVSDGTYPVTVFVGDTGGMSLKINSTARISG